MGMAISKCNLEGLQCAAMQKDHGSTEAMDAALSSKFARGSDLAKSLVEITGDKTLVEQVGDEWVVQLPLLASSADLLLMCRQSDLG